MNSTPLQRVPSEGKCGNMKKYQEVHDCTARTRPGIILVTVTLAAGAVAAALAAVLPSRPVVAPGADNWRPAHQQTSRALVTQDLGSGLTPADLVSALLGTGVAVSNIHFTGAQIAAGTFSGGTGIIGFPSGIILSSGNIGFVPGPNSQGDVTAHNDLLGDADLDALIPGYETFDACTLEFDFQCDGPQIVMFRYVFTSEEYNEWVNSAYNDVFGFFLNGQNIALVPGSNGLATSINNVNCDNPYNPPAGSFCNLYINNDCNDIPPGTYPCGGVRDTQMDGLLTVLTATAALQPGLNHIKLAIADAGDHILDSNVFIEGQSFTCGTPIGACCHTTTLTCTDYAAEADCQAPGDVWSVGLFCDQLNPPCTQVTHQGGEDCAHTIAINALPFVDVNTTCQMDNDYSNTCLGTYDNGDDILYELRLSSPQTLNITVTGATALDDWIGVAVGDTCPPAASCIASATTSGSVAAISNLALAPGIYFLMIDRWPAGQNCMDFSLSITSGAPTGACCHTGTQLCEDNMSQADCQAPGDVWHIGQACSQLIPPCAPPPGDGRDCEFPLVVYGLPYAEVNSTCGMSDDYRDTCLGEYDNGEDIVYELHISSAQTVDITVTGMTPDDNRIGVAVSDVCPPGSSCIAMASTEGATVTLNNVALLPGTYYVMIDRRPTDTSECFNYTLDIAPVADINAFFDCLDGPNHWPACPDPTAYDFDVDGDVDLHDLAKYQALFG